jgi:hypothetical protein
MVKVFISYSWDGEAHKQWVHEFATRLHRNGIDVILDQWKVRPGDSLTEFMEWAVRESDFVLCICTPRYKEKSDSRNGGAGYEGYIMTAEFFQNLHAGKFIPVLRAGEWTEAAPSWLLGLAYVDFRGNPYLESNWEELLYKLKNNQQDVLSVTQDHPQIVDIRGGKFEFVNREIELATLDPIKLQNSYWQCALISAPAGYGKSRLLTRLMEKIQEDSEAFAKWNWRYIDMSQCGTPNKAIGYFWEQICQRPFVSNYDENTARREACNHILENLSIHPENGSLCGVLLLIDSVDDLTPSSEQWLFSVFNGAITGSYIDYDKGRSSFPVRLILAGRKVEAFWRRYKEWETSSLCKYHLRSENLLSLSPFKQMHVEDLIDRKARNRGIPTDQLEISDIAERLLYLSGGHPAVINGILDELIGRRFRQLDDYLGENVEGLINNHITGVVLEVFKKYAQPVQRDIKTILIFRIVTLDILERLRVGNLIFWKEDNARLLGFLRDNQFLHFDDKVLCYHDDILRRIVYLDFAFGCKEQASHIQSTHKCAVEYYEQLIDQTSEQKSLYFIEWLFHALQINDSSKDEIILKWKSLLAKIRPVPVLPEDLKKAIWDGLQKDSEIKYIFRGRFNAEDFLPLFEN